MGYILLEHINTDMINIYDSKYSYKLSYNTNYIETNGIYLHLKNIVIDKNTNYFIIHINDKSSLELLQTIDKYLIQKLSCSSFLKNNLLRFKKNSIIDNLINKYYNTLDINICIIKKNAYQINPIVYIL